MTAPETTPAAPPFLHYLSGALILGSDWLLFSGTAATGGIAMPLAMAAGFLIGLVGITLSQHFLAEERWIKALGKGLLAGLVVGAPFPIGGTIVGGTVLASSGLTQLHQRAARALAEKTEDRNDTLT